MNTLTLHLSLFVTLETLDDEEISKEDQEQLINNLSYFADNAEQLGLLEELENDIMLVSTEHTIKAVN
jgi:hypothetical protein